jgi:hypothetical protein
MFKKSKSGASSGRGARRSAAHQGAQQGAHASELAASEAELRYDQDEDEDSAGSTEETARYIADMVGALAAMAGDARLDLLTYLLNMARVEAELQARQTETPEDED